VWAAGAMKVGFWKMRRLLQYNYTEAYLDDVVEKLTSWELLGIKDDLYRRSVRLERSVIWSSRVPNGISRSQPHPG
jgi:hypothetical protein